MSVEGLPIGRTDRSFDSGAPFHDSTNDRDRSHIRGFATPPTAMCRFPVRPADAERRGCRRFGSEVQGIDKHQYRHASVQQAVARQATPPRLGLGTHRVASRHLGRSRTRDQGVLDDPGILIVRTPIPALDPCRSSTRIDRMTSRLAVSPSGRPRTRHPAMRPSSDAYANTPALAGEDPQRHRSR